MAISALHSFLVQPAKGEATQPSIGGASLEKSGRLFSMLSGVYEKSESECGIDISFNHNSDGTQQNDCRDVLTTYVDKPTLTHGKKIAERLQSVTTKRSGLGLLFLIAGVEGDKTKLVVSRFPADHGILAEQDGQSLSVEFLEKVFMKSAVSYKAALYADRSPQSGYWSGKAVDKQINLQLVALSDYWIKDFLASDFRTTAAQGTKRLANALRQALTKSEDMQVKTELLAASRLVPSLNGKSVSMRSVARRFNLSEEATIALKEQLPTDKLFTEQFSLSQREYEKHVVFETTELDSGAVMMAPAGEFPKIFEARPVDNGDGKIEYTTQGVPIDHKLRKAKT